MRHSERVLPGVLSKEGTELQSMGTAVIEEGSVVCRGDQTDQSDLRFVTRPKDIQYPSAAMGIRGVKHHPLWWKGDRGTS